MGRRIEIVDYNPEWPGWYESEAATLREIFGQELVAIHHIGSTAVPGLRAKPVIDILVLIKDISKVNDFNEGMVRLGYTPRGECLDAPVPGTPGRFYFSKNNAEVRTHQVHVCGVGHFDADDKLAFRDYLRTQPEVANQYTEVKELAAKSNRNNTVGYMNQKDAFVKATIADAKRWQASQ
ncbi:MAG: GrpB family protein [Planctomycetes bacterium]|nr:GrpB family protein [Planctomycetota bacterium]